MANQVSYEQRCALLGIQRPESLRGKFPDAPNGALQGKVQGIHKLPMGERKSASKPPEDLSHLNPPTGRVRAQIAHAKAKR